MDAVKKATFTPGPWFASNELEDAYGFPQVTIGPFEISGDEDHVEETIAYVSGINHDVNANASLIAAAPDLLAALKQINEWLLAGEEKPGQYWHPLFVKSYELATAAIAKAEGR